MKTLGIALLILILTLGIQNLQAQSRLHYNFLNSLNEVNGNGPALTVLGIQGNFVVDTLSEIQGNNKVVYRFEKNNGVQFNNSAAGNFIGESYTIELYFVFDELTSWKRVVDWKNRKTDWGAYVYYGELNFYNILYSDEAPVHEGEYTYYVITRNGATKQVLIYTDAEVKIAFTDNNGDALIDSDGVLNFFYDDLIVTNEAASGAVAMLKLYNYVLDSTTIQSNWEEIGSTVFGIGQKATFPQFQISPNPVDNELHLGLHGIKPVERCRIDVFNASGRTVYTGLLNSGNSEHCIPVRTLSPGIYYIRLTASSYSAAGKFIKR
jgi:hypothetical protein